jgi:hypothetical protein
MVRAWRRDEADKVTDALVNYLAKRDGGCMAPILDRRLTSLCADRWGTVMARTDPRCWTIEHVHEGYGKTGDRALSDPRHTLILCWAHHLGGWATAHKDDERDYLIKKEGDA